MRTVFVSAGEASGDMHAAALIHALKARESELMFFGLGGQLMRAQGVELLYDLPDLAVTGFWEVARRLFHFRKVFHQTLQAINSHTPELAILIDYPGMNLRLAAKLAGMGIKAVYFIVPQVWAWKPGRIRKIEERVDMLLSILPFECELFDRNKLRCEYVGHPLIDLIEEQVPDSHFKKQFGIKEGCKVIGLLPGSRITEISRHYPVMLAAVRELQNKYPDLQPMTVIREEIDSNLYHTAEQRVGIQPLHISDERYDLLRCADVSIIASGTATLEAALCRKPFCVVYKTGLLTYLIAKSVINIDRVGLANIIAGKKVVPEYLQSEMNCSNLVTFCAKALSDDLYGDEIVTGLTQVRSKLGPPGAIDRAADLIYAEILK